MDIDFVVTWVDGNDPKWIEEKEKYSSKIIDKSNAPNRYRDWGLMKYWFRAVEKYTPWVRRIHFVTWGHVPEFLNTSHPKLNIVKHTDFIPKEYLPTFNSNCIDMNLFRIDGLSDYFVLFNDDIFINDYVTSNYFFSKHGKPKTYYAEVPLQFSGDDIWKRMLANNLTIINKHIDKQEFIRKNRTIFLPNKMESKDIVRSIFLAKAVPDNFTGFKYYHSANPFVKKTFEDLWEKETDILEKTCMHRFRSSEDVNQCLAVYWQIVNGVAVNTRDMSILFEPTLVTDCDAIKRELNEKKYKIVCINDSNIQQNDSTINAIIARTEEAMRQELNGKCSYEL